MARALRTSLDTQGQWTADELLAHLVDAECDDRHERRLKRLLKAARFFSLPGRHRGGYSGGVRVGLPAGWLFSPEYADGQRRRPKGTEWISDDGVGNASDCSRVSC